MCTHHLLLPSLRVSKMQDTFMPDVGKAHCANPVQLPDSNQRSDARRVVTPRVRICPLTWLKSQYVRIFRDIADKTEYPWNSTSLTKGWARCELEDSHQRLRLKNWTPMCHQNCCVTRFFVIAKLHTTYFYTSICIYICFHDFRAFISIWVGG